MEQVLLNILELLRQGIEVDDVAIAALCRKQNSGVSDVKFHVSKKKILPFYLKHRESQDERFQSWDIDPQLEKQLMSVLKSKPRRTASGVATITVITKPYPCGSNCLYCPNDLRMPKSYLYDEPACRRAERNFFDPYLQVASRLFTLEQMGHITDKIELIVLGGTWMDYPQEYRFWFINELFRALNDSDSSRFSEVQRIRAQYESSGIESDEDKLERYVRELQEPVSRGDMSYNEAWPLLYGSSVSSWTSVASWQKAAIQDVEAQHLINEDCAHRVVGLVVETRPETIDIPTLVHLRQLGCTKVQIGVQTLRPQLMALNERPVNLAHIECAFALLRAFGFKIHAHFMANLNGGTPDDDIQEYKLFVTGASYQPDEVKLYPCALIQGTRLCRLYEKGEWQPYSEEELMRVLVADTLATPPFIRISRMIRDFSAEDIVAGVKKTNFRQMVEGALESRRGEVQEIRFREIGTDAVANGDLTITDYQYQTTYTDEHFLQWVDQLGRIAGFLRLSLPKESMSEFGDLPQPLGCAMIREVHVYGKVTAIDEAGDSAQHTGLGKQLIARACGIARQAGFDSINVISAVGTRNYYRARGFEDNGLYQTKML